MPLTVYIESTVPSYYTALPSRDVVVLAHQEITREWWREHLSHYEPYISELVIQEISQGDKTAAQARLAAVDMFPVLAISEKAEYLAELYLNEIPILRGAIRDALHLAIASAHGMEFMVTWNCAHIARGEVRRSLESINNREDVASPAICTPEELTGGI